MAFLSAVQIVITLVGILAGAFSGATLAGHLADWLATITGPRSTGPLISVEVALDDGSALRVEPRCPGDVRSRR